MYNPGVGRFIQRDPILHMGDKNFVKTGNSQLQNLYVYCKDAPVRHSDPFGLFVSGISEQRQAWDYLGGETLLAINSAARLARTEALLKYPDDVGGKQDAYRHCLWNCFGITGLQGDPEDKMKWAADQHEEYGSMSPQRPPSPRHERETYMDYHNNDWGRNYGRDCWNNTCETVFGPARRKANTDCCKKKCDSGLYNGELIISPVKPPDDWVLPLPPGHVQPPIAGS